jgi:uncharacterized integral membrane protein (TIGR00698 family)
VATDTRTAALPEPTSTPGGWPAWLAASWRGVLMCGLFAMAASFVARLHGGPTLLYALLFGMAFHFLHADARIRPGVELCTGPMLRVGVALLGARITLEQIGALGWSTALTVLLAVGSTIGGGIWLARRMGMSREQGLLSGGATAICGASAALAIAAALPHSRERDRYTLLVVVAVTTLSTLAMLIYPLLARLLHLSPAQAGLFIGGSIHDVAQVVGAGYLLGRETGDTATLVKLFRVSLLVLVVLGVSAACAGHDAQGRKPALRRLHRLVPWFLWVFLLLTGLQSLHLIPLAAQPALGVLSHALLVTAIAALGIKTSMQALLATGWRPLVLLLAETLWLAALLLVVIAAT